MKVISLMVDFLQIVKLWRLSIEFYGVGQLLSEFPGRVAISKCEIVYRRCGQGF